MSQSNSPEREFEKLSKAITEAVMTSAKVRKIVSDIQKKDEVCAQSFMVLVLRLSTLTESLESEEADAALAQGEPEAPESEAQQKPKKKSARRGRKKADKASQFIDGEKLSDKEIEFQEFINRDFDQDDWLKQNKLQF